MPSKAREGMLATVIVVLRFFALELVIDHKSQNHKKRAKKNEPEGSFFSKLS
jgi:hypothetical protein